MSGVLHWVFSLVFWVLVVLVVVLLIRSASSSRRSEPTPKTPLEILKERYARSEIDREEYEEKKRDLS
jgi:putative membrane protein